MTMNDALERYQSNKELWKGHNAPGYCRGTAVSLKHGTGNNNLTLNSPVATAWILNEKENVKWNTNELDSVKDSVYVVSFHKDNAEVLDWRIPNFGKKLSIAGSSVATVSLIFGAVLTGSFFVMMIAAVISFMFVFMVMKLDENARKKEVSTGETSWRKLQEGEKVYAFCSKNVIDLIGHSPEVAETVRNKLATNPEPRELFQWVKSCQKFVDSHDDFPADLIPFLNVDVEKLQKKMDAKMIELNRQKAARALTEGVGTGYNGAEKAAMIDTANESAARLAGATSYVDGLNVNDLERVKK